MHVLVRQIYEERTVFIGVNKVNCMLCQQFGYVLVFRELGPLAVDVQLDVIVRTLAVQALPLVKTGQRVAGEIAASNSSGSEEKTKFAVIPMSFRRNLKKLYAEARTLDPTTTSSPALASVRIVWIIAFIPELKRTAFAPPVCLQMLFLNASNSALLSISNIIYQF